MRAFKLFLFYGFILWLIPFVISFLIFPLKTTDRPLFESIMPVTVAIATVLCLNLYYKKIKLISLKEATLLGISWFVLCIMIDLFMFMYGPMKMSLIDYMKDIGLTYLIIPSISIGLSCIKL